MYALVNWVTTGLGNGVLFILCQAITWIDADVLLI